MSTTTQTTMSIHDTSEDCRRAQSNQIRDLLELLANQNELNASLQTQLDKSSEAVDGLLDAYHNGDFPHNHEIDDLTAKNAELEKELGAANAKVAELIADVVETSNDFSDHYHEAEELELKLEKELHGYRKGYERLKAENRELWSIVSKAERDATRGFGAEVAKLTAERDEVRAVVAKLKEAHELVRDEDALRSLRLSEMYHKLEAERDEARAEVANLKEELDAVEKSNRVNYDHAENLKAENAKLREQLRVKGAGVPFELTRNQLAAFADSDCDSD